MQGGAEGGLQPRTCKIQKGITVILPLTKHQAKATFAKATIFNSCPR